MSVLTSEQLADYFYNKEYKHKQFLDDVEETDLPSINNGLQIDLREHLQCTYKKINGDVVVKERKGRNKLWRKIKLCKSKRQQIVEWPFGADDCILWIFDREKNGWVAL